MFNRYGKWESEGKGHRLGTRARIVLIALALLAGFGARHADRSVRDRPQELGLAAPKSISGSELELPEQARSFWVNPANHTPMSHVSSLETLPDGSMAAIWYGGAREGAADIAIYYARRGPSADAQWSEPRMLLGVDEVEDEMRRNIRKLGNAVLFADPKGRLWLVYVSVSVGGWSGSVLNIKRSLDNGETWSDGQRLSVGPFFNFSTLVRSKPLFTAEGWIVLPVYHEFIHKFPQMLWLKPGDATIVEHYHIRKAATRTGLLQPSVVSLDEKRAVMFLRDSNPERRLHRTVSADAGWTWSEPEALSLANPDSGIDALKLPDGRLLLAYNEGSEGRSRLRLAVSSDEGRNWEPRGFIENEATKEFSYPTLALDHRGVIHLAYTWKRERIKHLTFTTKWLDERPQSLVSHP